MLVKKSSGTVVGGRYRIEKVLGEGAMGVVYYAMDTRLDRPIALKLIDLGDDSAREETEKRVIREAQTPAKMNHHGIVTIYDYGVEQNYAYIAMEFVEGKTLWDIFVRKGRIPLGKMVEINSKICDALKCAHDLNFVHRDIKPANIMILKTGHVKVMDFGLAKGAGPQDLGLTKTGMLIGTPKYMSPEQIRGPGLDHRTDIYSMGVMLYELLTGAPPFPCDNVYSLLSAVLNEKPAPPSSKYSKIPLLIDKILLKAITKKPDERYQRIEDFAKELEEAVDRLREAAKNRTTGDSSSARRLANGNMPEVEESEQELPGIEILNQPSIKKALPKTELTETPAVGATAMIQDKWKQQQQAEAAFRQQERENRCKYRWKNENALETFCPEPAFPKSAKGFCFLHDAELDKTQANIRKNLEDRVRQKANLEGSVFRNCQLMEAQLSGAKMENADWSGSDLRDANLWEAQLSKGNFQNGKFDKANFGAADLRGADFSGGSLRATKFKNANMSGAVFRGANLSASNCKEADLREGNFQDSDFSRADLVDAKLDKANFTNADLRAANLTGASLVGTNLSLSKLRGAQIGRTNLRDAILRGANIERGELTGAKLREANLQEAVLTGCRLDRAELWGVNLSRAQLAGANLQGADLGRANLTGANLLGANLKGANLRGANLQGANLSKACFEEADLIEANLVDADLQHAELRGADLTGASIKVETFPIKMIPTWNQAIWDQSTKRQLEVKSWGFD